MTNTMNVATVSDADRIPEWYAEWKRLRDGVDKGGLDYTANEEALEALSEKICSTQPTSRASAVAQLEYAMDDFEPYMMGNLWKDLDRKLFTNLLAALKGGLPS